MQRVQSFLPFAILTLTISITTVLDDGEPSFMRTPADRGEATGSWEVAVDQASFTSAARAAARRAELELTSRSSDGGLRISARISVLYGVATEQGKQLLRNDEQRYEHDLILPVLRSALSDLCKRILNDNAPIGSRATIEASIRQQMASALNSRGIEIDSVVIRSIRLNANLVQSPEAEYDTAQHALQVHHHDPDQAS